MDAFAAAIEASAIGGVMRASPWAYPAANLLHLLGLVLLVGGIGFLDLRLIGAFRQIPVVALSRALTPIAVAGLVLMLLTGPLLFAADATALVRSDMFLCKMVLAAIAVANALAFRGLWRRHAGEPTPPLKLMALTSIGLWLAVAALGRLIAYT
ncbi:DUF6644 family protein [Sphingosinicella soli]|uniref:DUF6644 domain-containing protein n=1 Tax=Sphingosinicella soli TaxID=333708 RepID=A0A7W7AZ07_9SPHN|nr:DUF6644 family protein [Sphingosinicella soli]MBB4630973.1 hypothetical protein [Sphingosinicella soli]